MLSKGSSAIIVLMQNHYDLSKEYQITNGDITSEGSPPGTAKTPPPTPAMHSCYLQNQEPDRARHYCEGVHLWHGYAASPFSSRCHCGCTRLLVYSYAIHFSLLSHPHNDRILHQQLSSMCPSGRYCRSGILHISSRLYPNRGANANSQLCH